jgi:hypothetical protein
VPDEQTPEQLYAEVEEGLRHLAEPLERPRPGDWLAEHCEKGQTFRQYLSANPVRRSQELSTNYRQLRSNASAKPFCPKLSGSSVLSRS